MQKIAILILLTAASLTAMQENLKHGTLTVLEESLHGYVPQDIATLGVLLAGFKQKALRECANSKLIYVHGPHNVGKSTAIEALAMHAQLPIVSSTGEYIAGGCPEAAPSADGTTPVGTNNWETVECIWTRFDQCFTNLENKLDQGQSPAGIVLVNNFPVLYEQHPALEALISGHIPKQLTERLKTCNTNGYSVLCILEGRSNPTATDVVTFHQFFKFPLPEQAHRRLIIRHVLIKLGHTTNSMQGAESMLIDATDELTSFQIHNALETVSNEATLTETPLTLESLLHAIESFKIEARKIPAGTLQSLYS